MSVNKDFIIGAAEKEETLPTTPKPPKSMPKAKQFALIINRQSLENIK